MRPSIAIGAAVVVAGLHAGGGAAAEIAATATIAGGKLVVTGTSPSPNQPVRLDNRFNTTSNASKAFTFKRADYFPFDCIVDLKAGTSTISVPVMHCAAQGVSPKGAWLSTRSYVTNDVVTFKRSSWRAKRSSLNKSPATNALDWQQFVAKGARGARGATGVVGPPGLKGDQGPPGDQGPTGPIGDAGAPGPIGVTGADGNPKTYAMSTNSGSTTAEHTSFAFFSDTVPIPITAGQRLTAAASVIFRTFVPGVMNVCYSLQPGGAVTEFVPGGGQGIPVTDGTNATTVGAFMLHSISVTTVPGAAGTYDVGLCFTNSPGAFGYGNPNGWVRVSG